MSHDPQLRIIKPQAQQDAAPVIASHQFNVWHREVQILHDINIHFHPRSIHCIIGPSGGGKSTLIRSINRINDGIAGFSHTGELTYEGRNINDPALDVTWLRTRIGMVFQKPSVFPKSIYENVLFGRQDLNQLAAQEKHRIVETNLRAVSLWQETAHRLHDQAGSLSIGQQQRLCIARTLAINPAVILFDEPTSALDPVSTRAIEELMLALKQQYTIVFVTHNIQQARRIADHLVFLCEGRIIEQGPAEKMFTHPAQTQTRTYLNEEYCSC